MRCMPRYSIDRRQLLKGLSASSLLFGAGCAPDEPNPIVAPPVQPSIATPPAAPSPLAPPVSQGPAATSATPASAEVIDAGGPRGLTDTPDDWTAVRAEFDLAPDYIHLAGFLLASHPRPVREAIERHRRALDLNPPLALEESSGVTPVREAAGEYLACRPDEIALTDSTTMGLGVLYSGLPLRAGDEVLTTAHDHYSTHESLRLATERAGAVVRSVPLYTRAADASASAMTDAIEAALTPATRVVAITWVHSGTGVKTPVRAIADRIAATNAQRGPDERILLCVDGVHGFGIEDETAASLGCDFFVAGTHKWILGPRGTGIIWGRADLWSRLRPTIPHFGAAMTAWVRGDRPPPTTADTMTPGGYHSFEHRWALAEAFRFHTSIGKAAIAARIHELNRQCKQGLATMPHVTLHTPLADELSSGIVTFEVARMTPSAVVARLREKRIIATTTPYATSYARLAPSLLNSPAEIDTALAEIRAMG
jgi:isopenicillin-N epimerase